MRKLLLLLLCLLCVTQVNAQHLMCATATESEFFQLYVNDSLVITSFSIEGNGGADSSIARRALGQGADKVDNIYFEIHRCWYKAYVPDLGTVFTVSNRPGSYVCVGEHFIWFLQYVRSYRLKHGY